MNQLILHLLGDYVVQSDWMATEKTKSSVACWAHAITYAVPFLLIASFKAFLVILITHFLIDRFRLARYVVFVKNCVLGFALKHTLSPGTPEEVVNDIKMLSWSNCCQTGYPSERPPWLAVWLLIACDNTMHLAINYLAISYL